MKRILLLGASGSIGKQAIDVIKEHTHDLELVGAGVGKNVDFLRELLEKFELRFAYSIDRIIELEKKYPYTKFYYGEKGLEEIVKEKEYDMFVNALVGFSGFIPTLNAIYNMKDIALANKETLVAGGDLINAALRQTGVKLFPIDSEHSAIAQCLRGNRAEDVKRLIITGSGGAFRDLKRDELSNVTLEQALKHPNWNMGAKITVDSATMMNKGFEVMEAHHLFNMPYEKIDVILHNESVIHSMVEYNDGSIIAQLGSPDMRLPIKYALLYPKHLADSNNNPLDIAKVGTFHFKEMDYTRYPLVKLAKEIGQFGGNFGAILLGANDEAVDLFIHKRINFIDIEVLIIKTLKAAHFIKHPTARELVDSNNWAKKYVDEIWANS
ncbi:MAG: 1-deoxy-D-xylulose-5-phosphate reductoisomerase [Erysipelotrichaceae bacterium]|nr:1-deoxy-D-xylulose-5-phosphate reductoisomerase [Erysipelotrichaceae bacterium]